MRLLYLSHTDWRWARQRPQFVAESLAARGHEVHVRYRPSLSRSQLAELDVSGGLASIKPLRSLAPVRFATKGVLSLSGARAAIRTLTNRLSPDLIWITSPELFPAVGDACQKVPLVFDCMDLTAELSVRGERWSDRIRALEQASTSSARVFASSLHIADHLFREYGSEASVVRNAYSATLDWEQAPRTSRTSIGYFGTIAEWFDFELVLRILAAFADCTFHLWGPAAVEIPAHPRLIVHGPVPHASLPQRLAAVDALMMPFQVTSLVRGVDPVKLYEYVASGLPSFAARYSEIDRFEPYVNLYDPAHALDVIERWRAGELPTAEPAARRSFLCRNTWSARAAEIERSLSDSLQPEVRHP